MQGNATRISRAILGCAMGLLFLAGSSAALGQNQDPLIGTWNISGSTNGQNPYIDVESFNAGGTAVSYDTGGTNSSGSPGQSITLGKWKKISNLNYTTGGEDYIYDASGKLSLIGITNIKLTLDSTRNRFSGTGEIKFYNCSVSLCPGTLVASSPFQLKGKRF